ncbi:MAG: FecR domain-containing protein [Planctomycetes bacterium]|nr:FecR domain-containing protein [Planctomycetota bacterium]
MPDPNLKDLADAYFDGDLGAVELVRLEAAINEDEAFRRWFAGQCRRETALHAVIRMQGDAIIAASPSTHRLARRRRRFARPMTLAWPIAALAAAALLLLTIGLSTGGGPRPDVVLVAGVASRAEGSMGSLHPGAGLRVGDRLAVARTATLRFVASGAEVVLDGPAALSIRSDGLGLDAGHVDCSLPHQRAGESFHVSTPQAVIEVMGTRFSVDVAERTDVAVHEGIVTVSDRDSTLRLHAGQRGTWPVPAKVDQPVGPATGPSIGPGFVANVVRSVSLLDATSDRPVAAYTPLVDGAVVSLRRLPSATVGLLVDTDPRVDAVRFQVYGPSRGSPNSSVEVKLPFTYPGDVSKDINQTWRLVPGSYRVVIECYEDFEATAPSGPASSVSFTVSD